MFAEHASNCGILNLLLVLDSNEYLFALGVTPKPACQRLLDVLIDQYPTHRFRIPRLIVEEVSRHLPPEVFHELMSTIQTLTSIDEDFWVGADALVTENRHFLTCRTDLPFQVLRAEQILKLL